MTLGSLFDGSGTCPLAAAMCGITPVWASEIEPYPIRVTQKNFPRMKHLGDITQINGAEIEPVDIVTFGSPCQDLSVAGTQKGLIAGKRSSLFFEAIRIIMEMREATHGKYPRYAVWENVPGALSSNQDGTSSPSSVRSSKPPVATELMYLNLGGGVRQENLFGETPVASWEKVIRLPGECWTPNTGESPSVVRESTLSQILEDNAPEKYFLSARACEGILRRAEKRGKKLPLMLWEALVETIEFLT